MSEQELIEDLEEKRARHNAEAERHKRLRDELNEKTREWADRRDELNAQVRKLIEQANQRRENRDRLNAEVKEAKAKRDEWNRKYAELSEKAMTLRREKMPKSGQSIRKYKAELRALEKKHMTSVMSAEKEKALMKEMALLDSKIKEMEREIEQFTEVKKLKVAELLSTSGLELPSIVNQLEKGGIVRKEINIVMKPEKRLVTVYCPTCARSIEVENIYGDEEVGFDCPVCGRPYRITPGVRGSTQVKQDTTSSVAKLYATLLIIGLVVAALVVFFPWLPLFVLILLLEPVFAFGALFAILAFLLWRRWKKKAAVRGGEPVGTWSSRSALSANIIALVAVVGALFAILWHLLVIDVDFLREIMTAGPIALGFVFGYFGLAKVRPELSGELLLIGGIVVILVMMLLPFIEPRPGFGIATVPFLAMIGVGAMLLSTLHHLDRETQVQDGLMAGGGFMLVASFLILGRGEQSLLGIILFASLVQLGMLMIVMRVVEARLASDVSSHFIAAIPLPVGLMFVILGVLMILGGAEVVGAIELALISPFVYYGLREVFNRDWMYRLPFAAFLLFIETIALAHVLLA
ncbi:MAG: hypothetical protein QXT42_01790 [Thermoplasmata archaeon]